MKEYLKMSDVFDYQVTGNDISRMARGGLVNSLNLAANAINSHDELVDCAKYYEEESIYQRSEANRLQGALDAWMSIHDEDQVEMAMLVAEVERLRESLKWAVSNLQLENAFEWSDEENADAHCEALKLLGVNIEE